MVRRHFSKYSLEQLARAAGGRPVYKWRALCACVWSVSGPYSSFACHEKYRLGLASGTRTIHQPGTTNVAGADRRPSQHCVSISTRITLLFTITPTTTAINAIIASRHSTRLASV